MPAGQAAAFESFISTAELGPPQLLLQTVHLPLQLLYALLTELLRQSKLGALQQQPICLLRRRACLLYVQIAQHVKQCLLPGLVPGIRKPSKLFFPVKHCIHGIGCDPALDTCPARKLNSLSSGQGFPDPLHAIWCEIHLRS